ARPERRCVALVLAASSERFEDPELAALDGVPASLPGADRPVEVFYRNGHFIARVRGVRVLQSTPRPEWRQFDDEFCTTSAQIEMVYFDRPTRLALVHYNYSNGGCLCDDRHYPARIELSAELLAEAERRSLTRFVETHRERLAAELDE